MKLCKKALSVKPYDSYYSIMTNCVEIRLWFLTDSIVRIRAGFDGDFAEESYNLVMTAWASLKGCHREGAVCHQYL